MNPASCLCLQAPLLGQVFEEELQDSISPLEASLCVEYTYVKPNQPGKIFSIPSKAVACVLGGQDDNLNVYAIQEIAQNGTIGMARLPCKHLSKDATTFRACAAKALLQKPGREAGGSVHRRVVGLTPAGTHRHGERF